MVVKAVRGSIKGCGVQRGDRDGDSDGETDPIAERMLEHSALIRYVQKIGSLRLQLCV